MKTKMTTLAGIALVALGLSSGRANALQPGEYDGEAVRLLRAMAQALPLRTTSLQKIAPAFAVEKKAGLTWDEAVAEADRRFGHRQPERAAFLRKYLGKGSPESQLDQLHLRLRGSGFIIPGYTSKELVFEPWHKPTATMWVSVGKGQLLGEPTLRLLGTTIEGVVYTSLAFDLTDHLIAATREMVRTRGATMIVGQNTSSAGVDSFWVQISTLDGGSESLTFTSDLVLTERRVRSPK